MKKQQQQQQQQLQVSRSIYDGQQADSCNIVSYIMSKYRCHTAAHLLGIPRDALFALQQRLWPAGDDAEHVSSWERCLEQDQLVGCTVDVL
jgi:hypothetical protein